MNCIVIDDEPQAIEIIRAFCKRIDFIDLKASFRSALDALAYLHQNQVDLIFLDIEMPDLSGMEFLQSLNHHPLIIYTTAYSEYAVEGYEYEAAGYLLKPIAFPQFLKAVNRAHGRLGEKAETKLLDTPEKGSLMVKSGSISYKINLEELNVVEACGNHVHFVVGSKKILAQMSLSAAEALLPAKSFCRIHRSFIVNLSHIRQIEQHEVKVNDLNVPIGRLYRYEFFKKIGL